MNKKINQDEVKLKISRLKIDWEISNDCNSIFTELTFKSFREAIYRAYHLYKIDK